MIDAILENMGALLAFAFVLLVIFFGLMAVLLFLGLMIRAGWRWLRRMTWNSVIVSIERKAFRG